MARFYAGQRARVVRVRRGFGPGWRVGAEVRVVSRVLESPLGTISDYCVRCSDGSLAYPLQSQLEPILPEGHKPCEEQFKRDLDRLLEREGVSA